MTWVLLFVRRALPVHAVVIPADAWADRYRRLATVVSGQRVPPTPIGRGVRVDFAARRPSAPPVPLQRDEPARDPQRPRGGHLRVVPELRGQAR